MTVHPSWCSKFLWFSLFISPFSNALRCGGPFTTSCLGATDIRYDPQASNDAAAQSVLWDRFTTVSSSVASSSSSFFKGTGELQVAVSPTRPTSTSIPIPLTFWENVTIAGSRIHKHRIVYVGAYQQIILNDIFETTTFERDGTLQRLGTTNERTIELGEPIETSEGDMEEPFEVNVGDDEESFKTTPIDDKSYFSTGLRESFFNGKFTETESLTFLDANSTRIVLEKLETLDGVTSVVQTINVILNRADEGTWTQELQAFLESVLPVNNETTLDDTLPIPSSCVTGSCPTEQDWCTQDPSCPNTVSPYHEPPASVRPTVLAGYCIVGFGIIILFFYLLHRSIVEARVRRYKKLFAKRVADTIRVRKSMSRLSPQALAEEFRKIDSDNPDGKITKEELWNFMSTGKAGEMRQADFEALFHAIDLDNNGYVDFLEFCAFMGNCHEEYQAARMDRGSFIRESSRRLSSFVDLDLDMEALLSEEDKKEQQQQEQQKEGQREEPSEKK